MRELKLPILSATLLAAFATRIVDASVATIGPNGINSAGLTDFMGNPLTGAGIAIGQVEPGRPAKEGVDDAVWINENVSPAAVFRRDGNPFGSDILVGNRHGAEVASVMISTDTTDPDMGGPRTAPTGVATGAALYSSAFGAVIVEFDIYAAISAQHIATRNNDDVRAINMSMGIFLDGDYDGNQLLTQFVDWSAAKHNVLYVVAGLQGQGGINPIPKDNFNGITVAKSAKDANGVYRIVDADNNFNIDPQGDRTSIGLLAPGVDLDVNRLGEETALREGTSYAAPHVTGTVALLQQYGDQRMGAPGWNANASRQHEVMKAVLLNSADKIKDDNTFILPGETEPVPQGNLLGMERTVIDQNGNNWLESEAYDGLSSEFLPLDDQMGAGHLNAKRALQQFENGETNADAGPADVIGWDYGMTSGEDDINKYHFGQQKLLEGSFISITLAFDRAVAFDVDHNLDGDFDAIDTDSDGFFDVVDSFFVHPFDPLHDNEISDLDLYLLPGGALSLDDAIAASISTDSTVDHIFFQIPQTGEYEIWVHQYDADAGPQNYGIAWWAVVAPVVAQAGDFDGDGDVDGADFVAWQTNFPTASGATLSDGDADGDGDVDGADFVVWQTNFPTSPGAGTVPVPEPASGAAALLATLVLVVCRARKLSSVMLNCGR